MKESRKNIQPTDRHESLVSIWCQFQMERGERILEVGVTSQRILLLR